MSACAALTDRLYDKMNMLLVDDERLVLDALTELLGSPLLRIEPCSGFGGAARAIDRARAVWHCAIVDVILDMGRTAVDVLRRLCHPGYAIVVSGYCLREDSFRVDRMGAWAYREKTDSGFNATLAGEVCKLAPLGFILGGRPTAEFGIFGKPARQLVSTPEQWAQACNMGLRSLERTCKIHCGLTPTRFLHFYYALHHLLAHTMPALSKQESPTFPEHLCRRSVEFVADRVDTVYGDFFE